MKFRKHTRLKDFDYNTNGAYFITICTHNRHPLIDTKYKLIIEEELKGLENRFSGVKIDYYTLMQNHIHIIIFLSKSLVSIPRLVQAFKSITTLNIKKNGYDFVRFWQQNYYEHVIRSEKALYKIRKYIIENPLVEQLNWQVFETCV